MRSPLLVRCRVEINHLLRWLTQPTLHHSLLYRHHVFSFPFFFSQALAFYLLSSCFVLTVFFFSFHSFYLSAFVRFFFFFLFSYAIVIRYRFLKYRLIWLTNKKSLVGAYDDTPIRSVSLYHPKM